MGHNGLNGAPVLSAAKRSRRAAVERLELLEQIFLRDRDPICHGRVVRCEPSNGRKVCAPVKIEYDIAHDLLNLEFLTDVPIHDSLEVDGVVIDYAKDKCIVAIEVLDAGKRTLRKPLELIDLAIVRSRSCAVETEERPRKKPAMFDCGRPVKELRNRSE